MQINITIKGTAPLLLHKYTVASISEPKSRVIKGKDSSHFIDEWKQATYLNGEGLVVMPSLNLMASIFEGAKGMKKGKFALTRIVYTSLLIPDFEPVILYEKKPITIELIAKNDWLHASGAVISGRRIDRVRTQIPIGYSINFSIVTKDDALSADDIKMILDNAGKAAGLGDWRPSAPKKPGPYGTFEVVTFKVV